MDENETPENQSLCKICIHGEGPPKNKNEKGFTCGINKHYYYFMISCTKYNKTDLTEDTGTSRGYQNPGHMEPEHKIK